MKYNQPLTPKSILHFQTFIYDLYKQHGRTFSWRTTDNPYHILVSEIMLQQTQTARVEKKYEPFLERFPTVQSLAQAPLSDVLLAWQGLGYNRRAKGLHQTAQHIVEQHQGIIPTDPVILESFPSIGKATAASICAFAFNAPTIFIETNIRTVFIKTFFETSSHAVHDKELFPLVEKTIDRENPRRWYYALTDYGVLLKKQNPRINEKSAHYAKQSRFKGSNRQLRGQIIKCMVQHKKLSKQQLLQTIDANQDKITSVIQELTHEGFLQEKDDILFL